MQLATYTIHLIFAQTSEKRIKFTKGKYVVMMGPSRNFPSQAKLSEKKICHSRRWASELDSDSSLVNSLLYKKIYCTHGHCCLEGAIKSNATFSMTNWLRAQTEIQTIGFDRFRFAPFFAQFSLRCVGLQRSILLSVCLQFCNQTRVSFCKKLS